MPRDYKKELEWEQSKYRQLLFKVDIALAEEHRGHLAGHGIKPIEWLKHAISLRLVPPEHTVQGKISGSAAQDTDISEVPAEEEIAAVVEVSEKTATPEGKPQKRKPRAQSPTAEMVREWVEMHEDGMSFAAIASNSPGYEKSTIRKRVQKELTKDETGGKTA